MLTIDNHLADTHAHIFEQGLAVTPAARYVPNYDCRVEDYLAMLDANGIHRGVLVQPSFLGSNNSYMLAALRRHPERLRGVIVVDSDALDTELSDERMQELHQLGVRGIRLNLIGHTVPELGAPHWVETSRRLNNYGWHLEIQAVGQQWNQLERNLLRWPSAIVIDHLGLPRPEDTVAGEVVLRLAAMQNVWVKVSGFYRSPTGSAEERITRLVDLGLTSRLVFGSDWPATRFEDNKFSQNLSWAMENLGDECFPDVISSHATQLFKWNEVPEIAGGNDGSTINHVTTNSIK